MFVSSLTLLPSLSRALQATNWAAVEKNPRIAQPKLPKWVWVHDPEKHAHDNFTACVEGAKKGLSIDEDQSIPPNFPPGYKYEPWTIEQIIEDMKVGKNVELGSGDWA